MGCQLILDQNEYVESFCPILMEVIYSWSIGSSFAESCKLTDIFEGSIIRVARRLYEILNQLRNAALVIGKIDLADKLESCHKILYRGIITTRSLYIYC